MNRSLLIELREGRGLNQRELAIIAGISQQTISSLERGSKQPSIESLMAISHALGVEPASFFAKEVC